MPEFKAKYRNAQIYWIHCKDPQIKEFYVGSTCNYSKRKSKHIFGCNTIGNDEYYKPLYVYIRNNGGWNNFWMDTIEQYCCDNRTELRMNEQEWINILEPSLNKVKAFISTEDLIEYKYNYYRTIEYKNNRKQIIQCSNCDKTYTKRHKTTHQKSKYCKNYNVSASESESESFIESDTDVE
jgi:hypothetical protein